MRAELVIGHRSGSLVSSLEEAFGQHRPETLASSVLAAKSPKSATSITYAGSGPGVQVLAWPTEGRLYLYVESSGRLRSAAGDVWDNVRKKGSGLHPKLERLVLFDEDANDQIAEASVGLIANLRRPELFLTLGTGVVSAAWLAVALAAFEATGDLVLGAIPALVAAILAVVILIADLRSKRLVWR
jgi:hypothetical protein